MIRPHFNIAFVVFVFGSCLGAFQSEARAQWLDGAAFDDDQTAALAKAAVEAGKQPANMKMMVAIREAMKKPKVKAALDAGKTLTVDFNWKHDRGEVSLVLNKERATLEYKLTRGHVEAFPRVLLKEKKHALPFAAHKLHQHFEPAQLRDAIIGAAKLRRGVITLRATDRKGA